MVLIYLITTLVAFVAYPILAVRWYSSPFIGALLQPGLLVKGAKPSQASIEWPAQAQGAANGDRLTGINGVAVASSRDVTAALKEFRAGDSVNLTLVSAGGQERSIDVQLSSFPASDRFIFFYTPFFTGLILLAPGVWFFMMRRNSPSGRAFSVFMASVAVGTAGLFDLYTTHAFSWLWYLAMAFCGAGMLSVAVLFPRMLPWIARRPRLRYLPYILAALLAPGDLLAVRTPEGVEELFLRLATNIPATGDEEMPAVLLLPVEAPEPLDPGLCRVLDGSGGWGPFLAPSAASSLGLGWGERAGLEAVARIYEALAPGEAPPAPEGNVAAGVPPAVTLPGLAEELARLFNLPGERRQAALHMLLGLLPRAVRPLPLPG